MDYEIEMLNENDFVVEEENIFTRSTCERNVAITNEAIRPEYLEIEELFKKIILE